MLALPISMFIGAIQCQTLNNFDNMYWEERVPLNGSTSALTSCLVLKRLAISNSTTCMLPSMLTSNSLTLSVQFGR